MKLFSYQKQAGDTIVEVLISIGVVSLVLVGAFLVTSNSTKGVQDNHEHTEAQQHLQSQIELLRSMTAPEVANAFSAGDGAVYCRDSDEADGYLVLGNEDDCDTVIIGGTTARSTIKKSEDLYTFTITWDSLKGGQAREEFIYRYYPPSS